MRCYRYAPAGPVRAFSFGVYVGLPLLSSKPYPNKKASTNCTRLFYFVLVLSYAGTAALTISRKSACQRVSGVSSG
jgi:hypothetical protein